MNVIQLPTRTSELLTTEPGSERFAEFSAPFKKELSGVVDRLITEAAQELDALLARSEAQNDATLQAAETALTEQRRRTDDLAESLVSREKQLEELRLDLQREREDAMTAARAYETAESGRLRAEAACEEARTTRESMVSAYESRLHAMELELEAMRSGSLGLQLQIEAEAAERARLVATIRSVQQAFASLEPIAAVHVEGATAGTQTASGDRPRRDEASTAATPPDRVLTLVASTTAPPPIAAPRPLLDYLDQLFGQLGTIYEEDQRSRPLTEVVDRLTANLRCARDLFVKRANAEGVSGDALFDQHLSEQLNGRSETALSRHLAIAAHELAHPGGTYRRAEAS